MCRIGRYSQPGWPGNGVNPKRRQNRPPVWWSRATSRPTPSGVDASTATCRACHTNAVANPAPCHSQYTSIRYTERLAQAGIAASVGSVGDSYDNALAETINGLYKTELIKPRGPWRTVDAVEYATAEYIEWFNHRRLYEHCGDIPPVELENAYYAHQRAQPAAELSHR